MVYASECLAIARERGLPTTSTSFSRESGFPRKIPRGCMQGAAPDVFQCEYRP
jgi:hypothetical protein